ncbi:MAG: response regulator transcription factor [Cyanobacteria bacterium SZAS LIN-2]|nr:response regulator transcription factor [Cyanobacteria bacterium SZAS LIN-3]MBS1999459.1 response regulator transcription factor [Cyanobacteria bacterium SZAS LIN-2]MBS2011198.1 response regulator transcription factor [Cyanobacteria bacterium SZAS TMP-1]
MKVGYLWKHQRLSAVAKILLVEDDEDLASMIMEWLSNERHLIEVAYDGNHGMDLLKLAQYDVIVLDWDLPGMQGIDILRQFRAGGGNTPVIMLTGKGSIAEKEAGLDSGADDYVAKPFSIKELAARIRALLRRPAPTTSNLLQVRDIGLDAGKYRVTKSGVEVHLLPRDFALLEFFMRHPDEVFSADTLLARVWQSDSEASLEALRTAIKRIRKKLDTSDNETESVIENIPRVGYRLRR